VLAAGPRTPVTAFRGALLLLCAVLSVVADDRTYAALPIAILGALALAADRAPWLRRRPLVVGLAEAVLAGGSIALTGGADSPMLPYLLAPPTAAGLLLGIPHVLAVAVTTALSVVALRFSGWHVGDADNFGPVTAQWLLLGSALGLLSNRARSLESRGRTSQQDRYVEARALLQQLRGVSQRLPGGLDAGSAAEGLLQRCADDAPSASRSAVLVQPSPGALVPLAVRGTRRVPWRAPLSEPGPLQQAWDSSATVIDRRDPDVHGRRKGSTLVVVPVPGEDGPFGLVVLESYDSDGLTAAEVAAVERHVAGSALQLETALLFEELRSAATVAERDRLAREMHDGVAQELAYIGYSLDDLRMSAAKVDEPLAAKVSELRTSLTQLVSNLRLSITDLKTSVSSERGLGSALTSYVRAVGSGGKLSVHLSLDESAFRLPGEQEVLLLQVAQLVAQDARRTGQAANLWVRLTVDPPAATLVVEHDGPRSPLDELAPFADAFDRISGTLRVMDRPDSGVRLVAALGGGVDGRDRHAGR
jgi:signal transduction histidine kinase